MKSGLGKRADYIKNLVGWNFDTPILDRNAESG